MHKKVHQNIIFSIHRVKRNRLDSSSAKQSSPSLGPVMPKSTVTLSLQQRQEVQRQHYDEENCMMDNKHNVHVEHDEESAHDDLPIGEDTERELSLSREDDSDLSVVSDCGEEEYKCESAHPAALAQYNRNINPVNSRSNLAAAEERAAEESDSESIEDSIIGDEQEEESEYDEEAQWREEHLKLQQIFEKRDQRTSSISGSKVKLPYEMLINKLIDGLETPTMIQKKELPLPMGMEKITNSI